MTITAQQLLAMRKTLEKKVFGVEPDYVEVYREALAGLINERKSLRDALKYAFNQINAPSSDGDVVLDRIDAALALGEDEAFTQDGGSKR